MILRLLRILVVFGALAGAATQAAELKPLHKLAPPDLERLLREDAGFVLRQRQGLRAVLAYVDSRTNLLPATRVRGGGLTPREDKEVIWNTWQRMLDCMVALEAVEQRHDLFYRLKASAREDSFLIGYGAMLARYRAALEFVSRAENRPELDKILNDPVPELGVPGGAYSRLKLDHLNVSIASRFAAREALLRTFPGGRLPELTGAIRSDAAAVWAAGRGQGEVLTAKNALKMLQTTAHSAWLPVQAGAAEWMGDTQVYRAGRPLISPDQVRRLQPRLRPGDILLERREWFVSNIGLPGFWSHAALYIGTPAERASLAEDGAARRWARELGEPSGDLEKLLEARCGEAYRRSLEPQEAGHAVRIVEAMSEGVSLTTLEHSLACDSMAALRPRLPAVEKAQAILRAFHYTGRPYDFDFDFATDARLVCTEVVYKAYEPSGAFQGLRFPLTEMLGRKVMPANELARHFDAEFDTVLQQYDLVAFLDGAERSKTALESDAAAFRTSWKRPKWHILTAGK